MKQLRKWTVAAFCSLAGVLYAQTPSYSTYQVNKDLTNFTDWTASSLSKNFKDKHLKGMESQLMKQLAEKMLRGDYNSAYLLQSYKPIPSNKVLEQQLKLTNGYSRYENITGVYLEAGENRAVNVTSSSTLSPCRTAISWIFSQPIASWKGMLG